MCSIAAGWGPPATGSKDSFGPLWNKAWRKIPALRSWEGTESTLLGLSLYLENRLWILRKVYVGKPSHHPRAGANVNPGKFGFACCFERGGGGKPSVPCFLLPHAEKLDRSTLCANDLCAFGFPNVLRHDLFTWFQNFNWLCSLESWLNIVQIWNR